jgi:hypothetical protein
MPFLYPIRRTLILVAQPFYLDTRDLRTIAERVRQNAPDIDVVIVGSDDNLDLLNEALWKSPVLTVSFGPTGRLRPRRGPIFANAPIPKIEQYRALSAAGIPTPRTSLLDTLFLPNPDEWGPLLIVKPASLLATSNGIGLQLIRTKDLTQEKIREMTSAKMPLLVQQFIDTGNRFSVFRNLTLFGDTLYQNFALAPDAHPELYSSDIDLGTIVPEPPRGRTVPTPSSDAEVMALAKQSAAVFPTMPLLGFDIVRDQRSGLLYVIELNAGGNVWHLSSPRTAPWRSSERTSLYVRMFNPYQKAAEVLAATTRRHAS